LGGGIKASASATPPSLPEILLFGISHFIFVYAILSAVAAALGLFRVSSWYDEYLKTAEHPERRLS
jgi:hypothetical protein